MEDHFPIYDDDGEEILSFPNVWRETQPQQVVGADCFVLDAPISNDENTLILKLTGIEFREMFSALYCGAEISYPDRHLQIITNFLKAVHCPPEMEDEGGCINFKPYASFINYEPANPFNEPDVIPEGYINQPFHYNSDFAYPEIAGYQNTDVLVPVDAIPVFGDWGDLLGLHFPTIKLHVVGQGQIELDLLAVPLGGQVIIKVGSAPNIIDIIDGIIETGVKIVDLNQDVIAIPPESDLVIAEEINIDAPEGTDVYLTFVPKIDAATEFFGMGGGIRQIGLCGLETDAIMAGIEDIRWELEPFPEGESHSYYKLQKRVMGVWEDISGSVDTGVWMRDGFHQASDAWNMIFALRNLEDYDSWYNGDFQGWNPSPIKSYIDSAASPFDPSALEAAIAAAQSDADAAQANAAAASAAAAAAQSDADAAASAAAAAWTAAGNAQATANGAVTVNNSQAVDITALETNHNLQQTEIELLQAWQAIAQIAITASNQFQSDMPQPWGQVYDFANDGLPANWSIETGSSGTGGLFSELVGSNHELKINQIDELGSNGQGNVYMMRIAVEYTASVGETIYAGIFGINPPDTIQQYRVTMDEFDLYVFRFIGNDYLNFGWKVRTLGNFPFKVRAATVYGWGFPNTI